MRRRSAVAVFVCVGLAAIGLAQSPALRARLDHTFGPFPAILRQVAFSPDNQRLATSSVDGTVKLWRVGDRALAETLTHPGGVTTVAFSRDGQWLASGSYDGSVRIWRLSDGALLRTLSGHAGTVWSVAFSPDGQRVASGGDDSTVRLWRATDGALARTLTGGSEHVYTVAFSADSQWLASGGRERGALFTLWRQAVGDRWTPGRGATVRLWRVGDGTLQQALAEHAGDVWSVAFSPDGAWLASSSEDQTVKLFRLQRAGE